MASAKIAVSLDRGTLERLDRLVAAGLFPSRSRAIQEALEDRLARLGRDRLARECARLDPDEEIAVAEQGLEAEVEQWPEY